ncbi:MAG TPA: calmodulin-binding protein [Pirellulales bacterium]|nr:calmodulin-binding protein [Pirellulales bacterium]
MTRRVVLALCCAASIWAASSASEARAQQAFGRQWGHSYNTQDWQRFYHYPYVFYPQNFWSADYYRSSESLYYRYPPEMRIPVYNRNWHNYYPQNRRYHYGHQFILDTF